MWRTFDILPNSLQGDPQVQAACEALDRQLIEVYRDIPQVAFWPNLAKQVSPLLDVMMWEYHVDTLQTIIDGSPLTDAKKRELIDKSILWHQKKGTKWLLETALATLFETVQISEWYEYGGKPYYFKLLTSNVSALSDPEIRDRIFQVIMQLKNVRSWLDPVTPIEQLVLIEGTYYIGIMNLMSKYITVGPPSNV